MNRRHSSIYVRYHPGIINTLGTHKDNMRDAKNKNRTYLIPARIGKLNNKTVLSEENVIEIRNLLQEGWRKKDLSKKFNTSMENIR